MPDKTVTVTFRQYKDGCWMATSEHSPYFCIEADSLSEVKNAAIEAITFHYEVMEKVSRGEFLGSK